MHLSKFNQKIPRKLFPNIYPKYFQAWTPLFVPCKDDKTRCVKKKTIAPVPKTCCARVTEALAKCPKSPPCSDSSKTPPNDSPPLQIESAADVYHRAHKAIKSRAKSLQQFLETSTTSILKDMRRSIDALKLQDIEDMRRILFSIDKKMKILVDLDVKCAQQKKLKVFKLNDQANQSINACINSTEVVYKKLKSDIENVTDETCCKIDAIMKTIGTCRASKSPGHLEECVVAKESEAAKLLDEVDSSAKKRMEDIEKAKDHSLKQRKLLSKQISKVYQRETTELCAKLAELIQTLERKS